MSSKINSRGEPKLPVAQLTILSLCRFAEPVALTSVFPYLPEMIESFGVHHNDVAKWAGITSAIFSVSQCLTAIPWGQASDKYGRKPIILLAMTCAMSSSLLFGFSRSLRWALVARAFSGASNGNVGILRTTVAEMVPQKALQPRAFATLPLVWQVGSIVGPVMGGALASPAEKLPELFGNNAFFTKFPFLLPNLVNGVIFTCGLLVGILFLKESLEAKKHRRDYGRIVGKWLTRPCTGKRKELRPANDFESLLPSDRLAKQAAQKPVRYADLFHYQCNLVLLAYTLLALHGVAYDQLLPVMMHLPVDRKDVHLPFRFSGGFGIDSGRIGVLFTIYSLIGVGTQFTVFPALTKRYGVLTCLKACTFVIPFTYIATPYVVLMPTPLTQQAAVLVVMSIKSLAGVFAFPCVTILLTNSARSLSLLGTLNGIATSLSAVGRAIGPYLAGRTFTWGVNNDLMIASWWLLAVFALFGHLVTWWLVEGKGFGDADEAEKVVNAVRENIKLENTNLVPEPNVNADFLIGDDSDSEGRTDDVGEEEDESDIEADAPLLRTQRKDVNA